uniref:SAM-dependent MTase TRM10-type domain-containing protein n=1 Tax=Panagrolaimus sp. ES5 TaxID=591445 RepID=A0AC34F129_9BILA
MLKLDSYLYRLYYNLRKVLPTKKSPLPPPIIWHEPKMIPPSDSFCNELKPRDKKKLEKLLKETELLSRVHLKFPNSLTDDHWQKLMDIKSRKERINFFKFLRVKEKEEEKDFVRKIKKKETKPEKLPPSIDPWFFNPPYEKLERWEDQIEDMKLFRSIILNETPQLAVDCRYIPYLSERAQNLTSIQLGYMISANRRSSDPWPLHFVNFDLKNNIFKECKRKHLGVLDNDRKISAFISDKNYTEIFDPKKLVYLSPDADECLERVELDKTYIIGGIVDRVVEKNIPRYASLEMSMIDGIQSYRLPINENIQWQSGTQFLTLVTVMKILQKTFENNGNWKETMEKLIPARHVKPLEERRDLPKQLQQNHSQYDMEVLRILEENLGKDHDRKINKVFSC